MNNPELRPKILEAFGVNERRIQKDRDIIEKWMEKMNLPEKSSPIMIDCFLVLNKFNIEKAKVKIENYYKIRSLLPDLFDSINPALPHMKEIVDVVYNVIDREKFTPDFCGVNYSRLRDLDAKKFDGLDLIRHSINCIETTLCEGSLGYSIIAVIDLKGCTINHVVKMVSQLRLFAFLGEEVFSTSMKELHFLNAPEFADQVVSAFKIVLPEKLRNRVFVHSTYGTFATRIPKELIPKEYGGTGKSFEELNDDLKSKLIKYKDRFDQLDGLRMEGIQKKDLSEFDMGKGTFRRMSID